MAKGIGFPKPKHKRKKNHVRRNATRSRARMIRDLDALARQEVFERDGHKCIMCGSERNIQWAHVLSRRHLSLRWSGTNAMTLCAGCHLHWHHQPLAATDWFRKNRRAEYEALMGVFNAYWHTAKVNVRELWQARAGGLTK